MHEFRGKVHDRDIYVEIDNLRVFTNHAGNLSLRMQTVPPPVSFALLGELSGWVSPKRLPHCNPLLQLPFHAKYNSTA
jgi:hypothetical protein